MAIWLPYKAPAKDRAGKKGRKEHNAVRYCKCGREAVRGSFCLECYRKEHEA